MADLGTITGIRLSGTQLRYGRIVAGDSSITITVVLDSSPALGFISLQSAKRHPVQQADGVSSLEVTNLAAGEYHVEVFCKADPTKPIYLDRVSLAASEDLDVEVDFDNLGSGGGGGGGGGSGDALLPVDVL